MSLPGQMNADKRIFLLPCVLLLIVSGCSQAPAPVVYGNSPDNLARSVKSALDPENLKSVTVQQGDSLSLIARRFKISTAELARYNGISPSSIIKIGQVLKIPSVGGSKPEPLDLKVTSDPPVEARKALPAKIDEQTLQPPEVKSRPTEETAARESTNIKKEATVTSEKTAALTQKAEDKSTPRRSRFIMPVNGKIITPFGRSGSSTNDGVEIETQAGGRVVAGADGTVAFVSNEGGPMQSVVLLSHGDGLVSVYGRITNVKVKRGVTVRRGEEIAQVAEVTSSSTAKDSSKGNAGKLHFEIRRNSVPVDPLKYLSQ